LAPRPPTEPRDRVAGAQLPVPIPASDLPDPGRAARGPAISALLFAAAVATGAWLRLDQLSLQVIGDDEWHAVFFLRDHGYGEILRSFGDSDHSIPLTLYCKLVADTVGLSELAMRAPVLLFGMLALVLIPWLLSDHVGARTSLVFSALLAISPLHVYFSRYARPYSAMLLFGVVGVLAFERWWRTGLRRWAAVYAACAILGPWFMPVVAPFLLAPFVYALLPKRDGSRWRSRLARLVPLGLAVSLGIGVLLGPPTWHSLHGLQLRAGESSLAASSLPTAFQLVSGTATHATAFGVAALAFAGALSLARTCPTLLLYALFPTAVQLAALAILRPAELGSAIVLVRYTLPASAFALLLVAEGCTFLDQRLGVAWHRWPNLLFSAGVCSALLASGPLISCFDRSNASWYRPNSFTNHGLFQYDYDKDDRRSTAESHAQSGWEFYRKLAQTADLPGARLERVVEAPAYVDWGRSPFVLYQQIHKRPVSIGYVHQPGAGRGELHLPWPDPRFRFHNLVHLADHERMREQGVRYVVLHKRSRTGAVPRGSSGLDWVAPWISAYSERFGAPCHEDEGVIVFDLRRSAP
ncbi:MAG: glycosyltransferase family 39 protein, partial [Actinomycetota bacterium]|nr:glycosyltransferase family 39 protein [Actinomycetota bacterium]